MPIVRYVQASGQERAVEVRLGDSVMEGAIKHNVDGIDAECGGACACATCHVRIDPEWVEKVGARTVAEVGMLEFLDNVTETSRLSCQIKVTAELDGLIVHVPEHQTSQL